MTIRESAIVSIISLSYEPSFQGEHRKDQAFTRTRKLTFPIVVGMILRMIKTSIQISCNWLGDYMETEPVSKQAFSQARNRLSYTAFKAMHEDGLKVNPWPLREVFGKVTGLLHVMDQHLGFLNQKNFLKSLEEVGFEKVLQNLHLWRGYQSTQT